MGANYQEKACGKCLLAKRLSSAFAFWRVLICVMGSAFIFLFTIIQNFVNPIVSIQLYRSNTWHVDFRYQNQHLPESEFSTGLKFGAICSFQVKYLPKNETFFPKTIVTLPNERPTFGKLTNKLYEQQTSNLI